MTPCSLKTLLLAGLVMPALALAPMPSVLAQVPEHPHPGAHPEHLGPREGAPHGLPGRPGPGGMREGAPHAGLGAPERRGPGEEHRPGPGEEHRPEHAGPGRAEPPAPAAAIPPDDAQRGMRRQDREDRAEQRRDRREQGPGAAPGNGPHDGVGAIPSGRGPDERRFGNGPGPARGPSPGGPDERRFGNHPGRGLSPAGAAAIGAAAGLAGGFMAGTAAGRLDDIRRDRREVREGDQTFVREPGRTIVEQGDRRFIVHDPNDRFRELGYRVSRERRGDDFVDTVVVPGGDTILTFTTADGRVLRRVRRGRDGREIVLFENGVRPLRDDIVILPPPRLRIPRDLYVLDYATVGEAAIYDALIAPPVAPPPALYTLDQVLYSPDIRGYVRAIDINTINFDTGSWVVPQDQTQKLVALAQAINKAIDRNPNSVFLIEGYTDAVGNPNDNLSLSDRRAQSIAVILTREFNVPPENLTTQGYGDQNLKVNTSGPSAANRRVVVQNITALLASGGAPPQ